MALFFCCTLQTAALLRLQVFVLIADMLLLRQFSMISPTHVSSTLVGPVYKVLGGVDTDSYNVHPRR